MQTRNRSSAQVAAHAEREEEGQRRGPPTPALSAPISDPGRTCSTGPADSRVGLKISIAYGFNQLLCHLDNLLFPHCKAGGREKTVTAVGTERQPPAPSPDHAQTRSGHRGLRQTVSSRLAQSLAPIAPTSGRKKQAQEVNRSEAPPPPRVGPGARLAASASGEHAWWTL